MILEQVQHDLHAARAGLNELMRDIRELAGGKRLAKGLRKVSHPTGEIHYFFRVCLRFLTSEELHQYLERMGLVEKHGLTPRAMPYCLYLTLPTEVGDHHVPQVSFLDNQLTIKMTSVFLSMGTNWDEFALDLHEALQRVPLS